MSYGKMAPQAYTKQILQEAFEWWSEQPESFRSQIQDSDDLVGYYLRIHRGEATTQAVDDRGESYSTSSKESFSSELKGLAENLSSFEGYPEDKKNIVGGRPKGSTFTGQQRLEKMKAAARNSATQVSAADQVPGQVQNPSSSVPQSQSVQNTLRSNPIQPTTTAAPQQLSLPTMSNQLTVASQSIGASLANKPAETSLQTQNLRMDVRSLKMVKEVKELLNLSSDEEALRALISFGAQRFKSLLKP